MANVILVTSVHILIEISFVSSKLHFRKTDICFLVGENAKDLVKLYLKRYALVPPAPGAPWGGILAPRDHP